MKSMDLELELAKTENILLRLHRAFENSKRGGQEDLAMEIADGLINNIPTYLAMLMNKLDVLRNKVLMLKNAPQEEKVKILNETKQIEMEQYKWEKVLGKVEKFLEASRTFHKPEPSVKIEKPIGFKIIKKNPEKVSNDMSILEKLTKLANKLDRLGFYAEADSIDQMLKEATAPVQNVLLWQQTYNKRNNLKPGMAGFMREDGIWGPQAQNAYKKEQDDLAKQTYNDPRKKPFDISKVPLTPPK